MYLAVLSLILLLSPTTNASTQAQPPPPLYTTTIHHTLPDNPSSPLPLATLSYHPSHPHLSTIHTFTPPPCPNANSTALVSVAVILASSSSASDPPIRSSATALKSFHPPYKGRFRLVVGKNGVVEGASWHAGRGWKGSGIGDFDLLVEKVGARVVFDVAVRAKGKGTGAGKGEGGEEEEVEEKTLLQKYWWVLLGVAFLALSGGGGDK